MSSAPPHKRPGLLPGLLSVLLLLALWLANAVLAVGGRAGLIVLWDSGAGRAVHNSGVGLAAPDQAGAHRVDRGRGEHRPAHAVEVARQDVEAVDRPLAHGAPRARRDSDPAVDDATVADVRRGTASSRQAHALVTASFSPQSSLA